MGLSCHRTDVWEWLRKYLARRNIWLLSVRKCVSDPSKANEKKDVSFNQFLNKVFTQNCRSIFHS